MTRRWRKPSLFIAVAASVGLMVSGVTTPSTATVAQRAAAPDAAATAAARPLPRSPELSATTRLADRRFFVIGTRFYEGGAENATYPAMGFHTRGEMGGFWSLPIKLLDGVWFNVDGTWLKSKKYTSGWGYARMNLGTHGGVRITRTDVAPDGVRAGLIGLTLTAKAKRSITLTMDAHSELMSVYPWGDTKPSQTTANLPDKGSFAHRSLVFRDRGTPKAKHATKHNWAAVVGLDADPVGPQARRQLPRPAVEATSSARPTPRPKPQPTRCDDTAYGNGTGGQLTYHVTVPAGSRTLWFSVGGSDQGLRRAQAAQHKALAHPAALLAQKIASRRDDQRAHRGAPAR